MLKATLPSAFLNEAGPAAGRLRSALARVVAALPGPVESAADLQRALRLRKTLAWQVHRFVSSANPLVEAARLPGPRAMESFFQAARQQGVDPKLIDAASTAIGEFGSLVRRHAGDRAAFESMVSDLGDERETVDNIAQRRAAFNANASLWGVSARTQLGAFFCHSSKTPGLTDGASIRGYREIKRLRRGAEFDLSMFLRVNAPPVSIEAEEQRHSKFVLDPFCTQPVQEIIEHRPKDGGVETIFAPGRVGRMGAADLYMGTIFREMDRDESEEDRKRMVNSVLVKRPVQTVILDTLLERDLFGEPGTLSPTVSVYGSLNRPDDPIPDHYTQQQALPVPVKVDRLGVGSSAVATPDVPRYPEMLAYLCERAGWDPERFEVFRCRVQYPILNALIAVKFRLP